MGFSKPRSNLKKRIFGLKLEWFSIKFLKGGKMIGTDDVI